MVILDLGFYSEKNVSSSSELLMKHAGSSGHFSFLASKATVHVIKFTVFTGSAEKDGVHYHFVKKPPLLLLPAFLHTLWRRFRPTVILCHSFIFPAEMMLLNLLKPAPVLLILQHHGESVSSNFFKKKLQMLAHKKVSGFFFVSAAQAGPFIKHDLISPAQKIYEVMEGSTYFRSVRDRRSVQDPETRLLWVGRLNKNKDPLTVLKALQVVKKVGKKFHLKMAYGTAEMEGELNEFITKNDLRSDITLLGRVPHGELEALYCEADYYISASHMEGSGWALCEALACGCVPVVSDIPSFRSMTRNGSCGYLFTPGDPEQLAGIVLKLDGAKDALQRDKALAIFREHLSFEAIARDTISAIRELSGEPAQDLPGRDLH